MKHFNRFLCLVLALTMVLMAFAACEKKETEKKSKAPVDTTQPSETDPSVTEPPVTNPPETDPPVTNPPVTEPPVTEPPVTEPPVTEPPVTEPPETEPPVVDPYGDEPAAVKDLSKKLEMKVAKSLEWKEDNSLLVRYKPCLASHFEIACAFYEDAGYTLYCEDNTANTLSKTYVKDKAYATVFYLDRKSELHVTVSEEGAQNFPDQNAPYEKIYPVTMTQPFVSKQGLCEIFRLADGSFLLFDGSNSGAQDYIWSTLCELNGSSSNIHIRAWVLTHTHGDHYGGFRDFAYAYGSRVKLDTVFYNPVNRDIIKTIDDYKPVLGNTWDTIDYSFNKGVTGSPSLAEIWTEQFEGAKLCSVHAGQKFHLAGADLHILYTAEHLYIDEIPVNMNNTSIVSHVTSEDGKALVTGDSGANSTMWTIKTYYKELASDIFQIPHHGMTTTEDVSLANLVKAKIILIPCTLAYHEKNGNARTEEIKNMSTTEASFVMGAGTVTCKMDGTILTDPR